MKIDKKRLYLDDVRTPTHSEWMVVRNYDEFVTAIKFHGLDNFEVISLDHDLGDQSMLEYYNNVKENYTLDYNNIKNEKTGYDVAKFLVSESMSSGIPLPQIYVHSANPIGSANIMGYINNYFMNCHQQQTCVRVQIEHAIEESLLLSSEERIKKWKK